MIFLWRRSGNLYTVNIRQSIEDTEEEIVQRSVCSLKQKKFSCFSRQECGVGWQPVQHGQAVAGQAWNQGWPDRTLLVKSTPSSLEALVDLGGPFQRSFQTQNECAVTALLSCFLAFKKIKLDLDKPLQCWCSAKNMKMGRSWFLLLMICCKL